MFAVAPEVDSYTWTVAEARLPKAHLTSFCLGFPGSSGGSIRDNRNERQAEAKHYQGGNDRGQPRSNWRCEKALDEVKEYFSGV